MARDQTAFLVDQEGAGLPRAAPSMAVQLQQVVEVPCSSSALRPIAGACARSGSCPGDVELVHVLAQFGALVALDAARDAATAAGC